MKLTAIVLPCAFENLIYSILSIYQLIKQDPLTDLTLFLYAKKREHKNKAPMKYFCILISVIASKRLDICQPTFTSYL